MHTLKIPTPLRSYTDGQTDVSLEGDTVGELMDALVMRYPTLRPHLYNGNGQLRPFVNLFLNENNIKDLHGLDTTLKDGDRLMLIPSIAGG